MEWLLEHKEEIFGIIGAAYALARLIVVLTPSKKDNKLVNTIGKLFGLDKEQGVKGE